MKVLVATRSPGKQREMRAFFTGLPVEPVFPEDLALVEQPEEIRLETGATFEANARAKAEYFARKAWMPVLADDSGLEVFALGGEPGVRSKRFAGVEGEEPGVTRANNEMLLRRLAGAPANRRRARYRCVLAWVPKPGGITQTFEGACNGSILEEPRGSGGFGYDPLFLSDDLEKTFAEATLEEKDKVSHRGRAFERFAEAAFGPRPSPEPSQDTP